jgi:predicted component of type VI protein secretion system
MAELEHGEGGQETKTLDDVAVDKLLLLVSQSAQECLVVPIAAFVDVLHNKLTLLFCRWVARARSIVDCEQDLQNRYQLHLQAAD